MRCWTSVGILLVACTANGDEPANSGSAESLEASAATSVEGTESGDDDAMESSTGSSSTGSESASGTSAPESSSAEASETSDETKFDLGIPDVWVVQSSCKVGTGLNAIGDCGERAPPGSFEPVVQWKFSPEGDPDSIVTPLVINLTDDNDDGAIDLCDTPDVVLVAGLLPGSVGAEGRLYVIDGATGIVHFTIEHTVSGNVTPAVGDIDGDGLPEIVTLDATQAFVVFEHDGTLKWRTPSSWNAMHTIVGQPFSYSTSVALADVDNDADVEIIVSNQIIDHEGNLPLVLGDDPGEWSSTVPVDLDGDQDLEIVLGRSAFHHDGTPHFMTDLYPGYPQIADVDDDGDPEILLTNFNGISMLEADGAIRYSDLRPTGADAIGTTWLRPATFHDFDGDGAPEFALSSANQYSVYEADATIVWTAPVLDASGIAGSTAFDFLGQGAAQAMYADEQALFVFDEFGGVLLDFPRSSLTLTEYPVVADIDNDGSAEILVVSNSGGATIQAIADIEDRWIQARRIWNQHAYHVTNVREDGTIPQFETPHWTELNTFRTNAQIEGGNICVPVPEG